jgi:small subunit ribosomal protein S6e
MVEFRAVISDVKTGKSFQANVTGHHANSLIGKKIGDVVDGIFVGLPGYKLMITGGSDKDGFRTPEDGLRKKKTFRGNAIAPDTVQLNMKVTAHGTKPLEEIMKKEEAPKQ